ncbi:iron-sulfur cluster assembly scaffold protein [bacterium]|jgi:nitrogen fixation protein NifU and related proteins|nr:iron-sulfur cluster assembly scaffold protein [bacterium]
MSIKNLYAHHMQEHYKNPKNKGLLKTPDISSLHHNPTCGDQVNIDAKVNNGVITEIKFSGDGCVISMATASILTEFCKGKTIKEIDKLEEHDVLNLIKMELGPARIKCAVLSLRAIQDGIKKYRDKNA